MHTTTGMAERAYDHTKQLVLSGALAPGQLINEGQIAAELGISRTPVHEAFLRLDTERLLALYPRKGAAVLPMAPSEARDVVEMREAVEIAAVRRALVQPELPRELLDELGLLLTRGDALIDDGDMESYVECDSQLHGAFIAASGNATASHFYDILLDRQARLRLQLLRQSPAEMASGAVEHRALFEAFIARDADRYEALLTQHLDFYRNYGR